MDLKKPEEGSSGPKFGPPPPPHPDVTHQFFPFYRVFKDGKVERFLPDKKCPPSDDPETSVRSKDVVISSETGLSARIFVPKINDPTEKLPVLVYIHGGGFCIESAYSPVYHHHVSTLSAKAGAICVSVDYRLAPEHPIPACYEDCWEAFQWIASHANNDGPEQWLNNHADFERVYLAGDSAGANLTHSVVSRLGSSRLPGVKVVGAVLVHPYFGGVEDDKLWVFNSKNACQFDDPKLKPTPDDLKTLGCDKVLIFVGEKDHLHDAGKNYYEALKSSGWKGGVEMKVHEGKQHVFHLFNPACDHAVDLMNTGLLLLLVVGPREINLPLNKQIQLALYSLKELRILFVIHSFLLYIFYRMRIEHLTLSYGIFYDRTSIKRVTTFMIYLTK